MTGPSDYLFVHLMNGAAQVFVPFECDVFSTNVRPSEYCRDALIMA